MKMKFLMLCVAGMALSLSACKTTMDTPDGYKVQVEDRSAHPGTFCPPGQAKKGNC